MSASLSASDISGLYITDQTISGVGNFLTSDLIVDSGATVTFQSGTMVDFRGTGVDIIVRKGGTLIAEGSSASPIHFFSTSGSRGGFFMRVSGFLYAFE